VAGCPLTGRILSSLLSNKLLSHIRHLTGVSRAWSKCRILFAYSLYFGSALWTIIIFWCFFIYVCLTTSTMPPITSICISFIIPLCCNAIWFYTFPLLLADGCEEIFYIFFVIYSFLSCSCYWMVYFLS